MPSANDQDSRPVVPNGETFGNVAAHAGYSEVESLGLQNDETSVEESDRGIDLMGENMNEHEKLFYFEEKLKKVEKALESVAAYSSVYAHTREKVLSEDSEYSKLKEARKNVDGLRPKNDADKVEDDELMNWYAAVIVVRNMEKSMIDNSKSDESFYVRRVEALREYKSYIEEKIEAITSSDLDRVNDLRDPE